MKKAFMEYIHRTIKNKICALSLIGCGAFAAMIMNDATLLLIVSGISLPLFIARENWMY